MKLDSATIAASYDFVRELFDVVDAYKHSQCLYLHAKLGVADILADDPPASTRVKLTFHQMNDAAALTLLTNIRRSIKPNGRLTVLDVDGARHATTRSLEVKLSDINMFVVCGTHQRTAERFGELFAKAKFDLIEISPTPENRLMVLEAAPV